METLATIEIGLASVAYRRAAYPDAVAHPTAAAGLDERAGLPALLAHADVVAGSLTPTWAIAKRCRYWSARSRLARSTAYTVFRAAL